MSRPPPPHRRPTPALRAVKASRVRPLAAMESANGAADDELYPSSDGLPMADNQAQSEGMADCVYVLRDHHPNAYVVMNLLMYHQKGNPRKRLAPDVILAFGVPEPKRWRSSYRVWEEGKPPDWVLEIASKGTVGKDKGKKKRTYARIGVPEYWLFDAQGTVFRRREARLQGFTLGKRRYRRIPPLAGTDGKVVHSKVLGLDLLVEGDLIRFRDPATGKPLERHAEIVAARNAAERRAAENAAAATDAEARATDAEARVAELEALVRRLQRES